LGRAVGTVLAVTRGSDPAPSLTRISLAATPAPERSSPRISPSARSKRNPGEGNDARVLEQAIEDGGYPIALVNGTRGVDSPRFHDLPAGTQFAADLRR
jgi:hypothetical protein